MMSTISQNTIAKSTCKKEKDIQSAIFFIEQNKYSFIDFLCHAFYDAFPVCCDHSSQILFSYIIEHFQIGEIWLGYHKLTDTPHSWGKIGDVWIDFTFSQFIDCPTYIDKTNYDTYIKNFYSTHELPTSFQTLLKNEHIIQPVFCDIAKDKSFDEYLLFFQNCREQNLYESFQEKILFSYLSI